jgi:ABC-type multidrug transport system fused ATPase/permease subunit
MGVFKKLGWFFKQEKKRYTIGILFLALTSVANLVPPRILGLMADRLDAGKISWAQYGGLVLAVIAAALALFGLRYVWRKQIWGGGSSARTGDSQPSVCSFFGNGPDLFPASPHW